MGKEVTTLGAVLASCSLHVPRYSVASAYWLLPSPLSGRLSSGLLAITIDAASLDLIIMVCSLLASRLARTEVLDYQVSL